MSTIDLKAADNIRILSAAMVEKAKSGHPGGAMGAADFIHLLYSEFLNFDPDNMEWPCRDRFFPRSGAHVTHAVFGIAAYRTLFHGRYQKFPAMGKPHTRPS